MINNYAGQIDESITVPPAIAERYQLEFGLRPTIVLNASKLVEIKPKTLDPANLRLIYHGGATRECYLEKMIQTIVHCDSRYTLHFMLVETSRGYITELQQLAKQIAPGRVFFHPPVAPSEIVWVLAQYDIGFFLLKPNSFNYASTLPNKLFDFLAAGLAVWKNLFTSINICSRSRNRKSSHSECGIWMNKD